MSRLLLIVSTIALTGCMAAPSRVTSTPSSISLVQQAAAVEAQYWDANERCRGGSGDRPETWQACEERGRYGARLEGLGWCYGLPGETRSDRTWHRCRALSPQRPAMP